MTKIEELQQRLQQLSQERSQLSISYNQFTGAMMEVERQIAEEQQKIESSLPSNTKASTPQEETASST
tara:strand:+ start:183 stop:386 length:204 start_codon:yes stop_codon:yes gene_type:complete